MSDDLTPHTSGYMKPPKSKRFKKGKSGNAKGGPKQTDDPTSVIIDVLNRRVAMAGSKRKITMLEALSRKLRELALNGDPQAVKLSAAILKLAAPTPENRHVVEMRKAQESFRAKLGVPIELTDEELKQVEADHRE